MEKQKFRKRLHELKEEALVVVNNHLKNNKGQQTFRLAGNVEIHISYDLGIVEENGNQAEIGSWLKKLEKRSAYVVCSIADKLNCKEGLE